MYRQLKGALLVLLSACGYGLAPLFAFYAYRYGINVPTLLLFRFVLAALFLLSFLLLTRRRLAVAGVQPRELFYLFLLGGICYTLSSTFYFTSIRYITASLATLILYAYPILVVLLDCLLKFQKPTLLTAVSGGISFAGVLLMVGTVYGVTNGFGVLLSFGAALAYSIFIILGHRVIKGVEPLTATTFITVFTGVGILVTSFFTTPLDFSFQTPVWGYIGGIALFSTIIAILTFFRGLELLGPVRASILSMSEPLFTVLGTVILLQERLTAVQLFGGAAVLTGAVLVNWPKKQKDPV